MGIVSCAKSVMDSDTGVVIMSTKSIIMGIISIVTASLAFANFASVTDELSSLVGGWEKAPITGFHLSDTQSCPDGYSLLDGPKWPGASSSACACPYGANYEGAQYSDGGQSCDGNQTNGEHPDTPCII